MAKLIPEGGNLATTQNSEIEILKTSPVENILETEALLNSYAASLKRASALLQRALKS